MLKKLFVLLFVLPLYSSAQNFRSTLIFSAEQGDAFFVYLNGKKQNAAAQANVTIHGLELPYYDVRIEFLNSAIKPIEKKNIAAADSDDKPMQVTYKVRKDKSGKARLSFYAMLPPVSVAETHPAMFPELKKDTVAAATPDTTTSKALLSNVSGAKISFPKKEETRPKADSALKVEVAGTKKEPQATNKPQIKPTTAAAKPVQPNVSRENPAKKPVEQAKKEKVDELPPLKKCNDWPLMKEEFQKIKQQLVDVKSESTRLVKAKSLSSANCLLVSQVGEIASLFTSDAARLDFMRYAYSATIDRPNFDRLKKLISDAAVKNAFDKFLASHR